MKKDKPGVASPASTKGLRVYMFLINKSFLEDKKLPEMSIHKLSEDRLSLFNVLIPPMMEILEGPVEIYNYLNSIQRNHKGLRNEGIHH